MLFKILFVIVIIITILLLKFTQIHIKIDKKLNIKSNIIILDIPIINLYRIRYKRFGLYLIQALEKESSFYISGKRYEKLKNDSFKGFNIYFKRMRVTLIIEK